VMASSPYAFLRRSMAKTPGKHDCIRMRVYMTYNIRTTVQKSHGDNDDDDTDHIFQTVFAMDARPNRCSHSEGIR